MRRAVPLVLSVVLAGWSLGPPAVAAEPGSWRWPVVGPVLRAFDPPATPFGSGHRGIDVAAVPGTPIGSPAPGTVTFAGPIGGELFVTVAHGGGWESTASWVSSLAVRRGDAVFTGQTLGLTGRGHPGALVPHVHLGVRHAGSYVDPLSVYASASVVGLIRLAPI